MRPGGFEPLAFRVGAERSIQLSYDRLCMKNVVLTYFNLVKWSIRGLTTVDHRVFASTNHAVSNKNEPETCDIAVVGGQCSIQLSYGRRFMNYCQTEPRARMPL